MPQPTPLTEAATVATTGHGTDLTYYYGQYALGAVIVIASIWFGWDFLKPMTVDLLGAIKHPQILVYLFLTETYHLL